MAFPKLKRIENRKRARAARCLSQHLAVIGVPATVGYSTRWTNEKTLVVIVHEGVDLRAIPARYGAYRVQVEVRRNLWAPKV